MRTCPFNDCDKPIPEHLFACGQHWRALAKGAQNRITSAYTGYLAGTVTVEELRRIQQDVLGPRGT